MSDLKISVSDEDVRVLMAAQIESEARKEVVALCVTMGLASDAPFEKYQNQYIEHFTAYNKAKEMIEKKYILDNDEIINKNYVEWKLNFETHVLEIKY